MGKKLTMVGITAGVALFAWIGLLFTISANKTTQQDMQSGAIADSVIAPAV